MSGVTSQDYLSFAGPVEDQHCVTVLFVFFLFYTMTPHSASKDVNGGGGCFFVFLCCSHGFLVGFLQGQLKISAASQFWVEFVLHDDATQHQQRGECMVTADVFRDLVSQSLTTISHVFLVGFLKG